MRTQGADELGCKTPNLGVQAAASRDANPQSVGVQNPKPGWLQTFKPQDTNPQPLGCKTPSPLVVNPMLRGANP